MPPPRELNVPTPAVRRRRHVGRWILLAFVVVFVGALATIADGYFQALQAGRDLKTVVPLLQSAREDLLSGQGGDARFQQAEVALREVRSKVDGARFTFGWTGALPFVGRPVQAVRLGTDAATEAMDGLRLGRGIVHDLTGGPQGSGLLHDGVVDLALVRSLESRVSQIVDHLTAARDDLDAIPSIPLFSQLDRLKADAVGQANDALRSGRRALEGVGLIPSLLGADGPRTYFLALQNNADLRGTGGAVLAYGLLRVADGRIHLLNGGAIQTLDQPGGIHVPLPPEVGWYHRVTGRPVMVNNGVNYSPNFPVVASVWAAQVEAVRHIHVDGVIAIDPDGAAALFAGQPPVTIAASPQPIDAGTVASFTEHGQYSLPEAVQKALPAQLIGAAFEALTSPHDILAMTEGVGTALADKRIQLWFRDGSAARVVHRMGWDGAIHPGTGDYLLLTDNKRNPNKIDYFTQASLDYTIRLDPDGTGHATADVTLDTNVPAGESPFVVGPAPRYGLNVAMLGLHVPERALTTAHSSTAHVNYRTRPLGFLAHKESGVKVLTQTVASWDGHPAGFHVTYDIADLAHRDGAGWTYTLTMQHQPVVHPLHVSVTVVAPAGSTFTSALPGWTVNGNRAQFRMDLTKDLVTSLSYRPGAGSTGPAATPPSP